VTDDEKEKIIKSWCYKFIMNTYGDVILVTIRVRGFDYPVAAYLSVEAALEETYTRCRGHAWAAVQHVESSRDYGFWP